MYRNNEVEERIDIKDILAYVLLKWKLLVLAGLVFAVLLPGAKYMRDRKNAAGSTTISETDAQALELYNANNDAVQRSMTGLQTQISQMNNYLDHSVYMQLDPFHVPVINGNVVIKARYSVNTQDMKKVADEYSNYVRDDEFLAKASEQMGIEVEYLRELIKIQNEDDYQSDDAAETTTTVSDQLNIQTEEEEPEREYRLYITTYGLTIDDAKKLYTILTDGIIQYAAENPSMGCTVVNGTQNSKTGFYPSILSKQNQYRTNILNYNKSLSDLQKQLDALVAPTTTTTSKSVHVKKSYVVLGFAAGVFLLLVLLIVRYLFSKGMHTTDEIQDLYDLNAMGEIRKDEGRAYGVIENMIRRTLMSRNYLGNEVNYDLICADIKNVMTEDMKSFMLTGQADAATGAAIAAKLGERLAALKIPASVGFEADILKNAESRLHMTEYDAVILVEELGVSTMQNVLREIQMTESAGRTVAGYITVTE